MVPSRREPRFYILLLSFPRVSLGGKSPLYHQLWVVHVLLQYSSTLIGIPDIPNLRRHLLPARTLTNTHGNLLVHILHFKIVGKHRFELMWGGGVLSGSSVPSVSLHPQSQTH